MRLQVFDREIGLPKQRVSSRRDLNIGTATPKVISRLGQQLDQIGNEVAAKVKVANQTMEYSKKIADAKTRMVEYYTSRSQDVPNHETLVEDTNGYFKKLSAGLVKGVSDLTQKARIQQGLDQVGVSFNSQAASDANQQAIMQIRADHVQLRESKLQNASISTDKEMAFVIANYSLELRNLSNTGIFDPDKVESDILSFGKEAVHGKVKYLINNNPWTAKDYLKDKKSMSLLLDPVQKQSLISQAQTQINVREARQRTQENASLKAIEKATKVEVAATVKQLKKGVIPDNYGDMLNTVKGTEHEPKLVAAHSVADDVNTFNGMNPNEKQEFINSAKANGRISGVEAEKIDILEKNLEHTRKELKNGNGLELAFEQGVIEQLPPVNYGNPEILFQRKGLALMASEHYQQEVSPITEGEASQLIGEMDLMTISDRADVLGVMVGSWGEMALPAFEQIAKKNGGVYAISGALISEGRVDAAIETMKGMETMKAHPKIIPSDFIYAYDEIVGDAYIQSPEQSKYIRESVQALYAQLMAKQGQTVGDTADGGDIETALNAITGGIYELDIETFGWNDTYKIESPGYGVEQDEFEDWLEGMTADDIQTMGGTADNEDVARRINEGKVKLITIGSGHYGVQMTDGRPVVANDGRGFVLRYPER